MIKLVLIIYFQAFMGFFILPNFENPKSNNVYSNKFQLNKMKIKIGEKTYIVTLFDNPSANALKKLLPLTIEMKELNNNEKYGQLPKSLPTNASIPSSIQSEDLMLYGSSTLVLFYKGFSTTYSYTKIGKIDDIKDLEKVLGKGDAVLEFDNL